MWNWWICDLQSGQRLYKVLPTDGSWNISASQPGGGSHSFLLDGPVEPGLSAAQWRDASRTWVRVLVQSWDNEDPIYAGVVTSTDWDEDDAKLTLEHSELRTIFSRRFIWGYRGYENGTDLNVNNVSPSGALNGIVNRGAFDDAPDGHPWRLRIVRPTFGSGDINIGWPKDGFETIEDALTRFEDMGYHVWFRPRWTADSKLEHVTMLGDPLIPGVSVDIPVTSETPIIRGLKIKSDGSHQLTGVFSIGNGSGESMLVGFAGTFQDFIVPILDRSITAKQEESGAILNGMAAVELETHRDPIRQRSFSVMASALPTPPGGFTIGARVRLGFFGHPLVEDGWQNLYVIAVSGTLDDELALTTQEV